MTMFTPNTKLNKIMMIMSYSIVTAVYSVKLKMDGGQFDSLSQPKPVSIGNHLKKIPQKFKLVLENAPIKDANETLTPKDSDSNKPNSTPSEPETGSDFGSEPPSEDIPTRPGSADSNNNNIDKFTFKSVKFTSDSVNRDASISPPPTCTLPINETISGQESSVSTACPSTSDSQSPVRSRRGSNCTNASSAAADIFDNRSEMSSPPPGEPTTSAFPEQTLPSGSNMSSTDQSQASKAEKIKLYEWKDIKQALEDSRIAKPKSSTESNDNFNLDDDNDEMFRKNVEKCLTKMKKFDDVKDDTKMSISEFLKKKVNVNPTSEFNVNNNTVEIEKFAWKDIKKALEDSAIPNELDFETEESPMIKEWKKEINKCTTKMEESEEVTDETRMSKNDFMEKRCFDRFYKKKYEAVFDKMSLSNIPEQKAAGEPTTVGSTGEATMSSEANNILLDKSSSTNSDVGLSLRNTRFAAETKSILKQPDPAVTLIAGEAETKAVGDDAAPPSGTGLAAIRGLNNVDNDTTVVEKTPGTQVPSNSGNKKQSALGERLKIKLMIGTKGLGFSNNDGTLPEHDKQKAEKRKDFEKNYVKDRNRIIWEMKKFPTPLDSELNIHGDSQLGNFKEARKHLKNLIDELQFLKVTTDIKGTDYSEPLQIQDVQKIFNLLEFQRIVSDPKADEMTLRRLSQEIANRLKDQPIFMFDETRKGVKDYFEKNYKNDIIDLSNPNAAAISTSKTVIPLYTEGNSLANIVQALGEFEDCKKSKIANTDEDKLGKNGIFHVLKKMSVSDSTEDIYAKMDNFQADTSETAEVAEKNLLNEINIYKKLSAKKFTKIEFQKALENIDKKWLSDQEKTMEIARNIVTSDSETDQTFNSVSLSITDFVRKLKENSNITNHDSDSNKWLKILGNHLNPYFPTVFFAGIFNKAEKRVANGVIGMEKLDMINLEEYLANSKPNTVNTISIENINNDNMNIRRKIAKNMMKALAELHSGYGIAHKDLNKKNVMVCISTGNVKLLDFGFAKDTLWIPLSEFTEFQNDLQMSVNSNSNRLYNLAYHDIDLMLSIIQEVLNISDFELTTGIFDKDNQFELRYHPILYFLLRFPGRDQYLNEFRPSAKVIANLLDVLLPDINNDNLNTTVTIDVDALTEAIQGMKTDLSDYFGNIFMKELEDAAKTAPDEAKKMIRQNELYQMHMIIQFLNFLVPDSESDSNGVLSKSQFGCNDKLLNELKKMKGIFYSWYKIAGASYTKINPGTDLNKMIKDYEENERFSKGILTSTIK